MYIFGCLCVGGRYLKIKKLMFLGKERGRLILKAEKIGHMELEGQ